MGRTKQSPSSSASFWRSRSRSASAPATTNRGAAPDDQPLGCMSVVHYLIFAPGAGCVGRPPSSSSSSSDAAAGAAGIVQPRGNYDSDHQRDVVEDKENRGGFHAPRNSLDLDVDRLSDVQIGVQIEPVFDALACRKTRAKAATGPPSEAETPRTPSLVARLMGIDGLPDTQEPSPAQQRKNSPAATNREKKKRVIPESLNRARREPLRSLSCNVPSFPTAGEARSLPDTPRASASARASWDGARMSLQALKENMLDRAAQYMSLPTSPTSTGKQNNTKKKKKPVDARRTAKEIVRQAKEQKRSSTTDDKENVSPVPLLRKDKLLAVGLGHQAPSKPTAVPSPPPPPLAQRTEKRSPLAPRSAALAPKQQPPPPPPQRVKPSRPPPPPPPLGHTPKIRAKKPDGCERFATQVKKPSPAPAPPSAPPSPSTSSSSPSVRGPSSTSRPPSAPLEEDPQHSYLRAVLERGGFMRTSPPSRPFNKRHSVSTAPVDSIVFHLLELELPADDAARLGPLRHRWNRKLMFHLAQEILADLLLEYEHEYIDATSCSRSCPAAELRPRGAALLDNVWKRVRCFPAADCRVVGDIDALVATDMDSTRRVRPSLAEETGDVAEEVAEQVLEALLGECVCVAAESVSLSSDSDQVGGGGVTRRDVDTDRTGNRGGAHYHAPPATASIERAESSI